MSATRRQRSELRSTGYEIFIGLLSALTIFNLALAYLVRGDRDVQTILLAVDIGLSAVFLIDFVVRFAGASSKRDYFFRQFGWADLLSAVPLNEVKAFRLLRLVRVVQLFREVGFTNLRASLRRVRAENTLLSLLLVGVLVMEFGSLQILTLEREAPDGNIDSASDALWYTLVTISTVGYGDHYPTTNSGRVIGVLLIVVGVGLFAAFTGFLADRFLSPSKRSGSTTKADDGGRRSADEAGLDAVRSLVARPGVTVDEIADLVGARAARDDAAGSGP